ncbi:MAG: peptidase [Evtepia sp.]|nr:peptidase [Evtepia sp.]
MTQRYMLKAKHNKVVDGKKKVQISGGFGILLGILLFLDEQNIVPWALVACFLHELGHVFAIHLLGGKVQAFHVTIIGAEILPIRKRLFSYREELLIAAAGPIMSLALAVISASCAVGHSRNENVLMFSGLNLAVGVFNLLPAGPLDGGRMLKIFLLKRFSLQEGEQVYYYISALFSIGLLSLGIFHLVRLGGNVTLLLTGIWLLTGVRRNHA